MICTQKFVVRLHSWPVMGRLCFFCTLRSPRFLINEKYSYQGIFSNKAIICSLAVRLGYIFVILLVLFPY